MKGDGIMFSWSLLIGGFAYIIAGKILDQVVSNYLWELTDKVMSVYGDERYAKMLWYDVPVRDTKWNRLFVNMIFTIFWPVIYIAAILKAEWNYDKIMRRNAFRKEVP